MATATQKTRVLEYMKDFGGITPLEALSDLGVMRLASRISDLRELGYPIKREMVKRKNRYGQDVRFARYSLDKEADDE